MPKIAWCDYLLRFPFHKQDDPERRVDIRVKEAMGVQKTDDRSIRSYAFVISVWDYHFSGAKSSELASVKNEQSGLIDFVKGQQFDEAVILNNSEASPDLIRKIFTEYYLPQFALKSSLGVKIRFMFIFDGHGWRPPSNEATGALALADLEDEGDLNYDHRFSLAELRGLLQDLSPYTQSMVALLGSCYSGSVFTGKSYAEDFTPGPAAWIATAVPGWTEASALPDKMGTVFFQDLMSVVNTWKAAAPDLPPGDSAQGVDFGLLTPKLREIIDTINEKHQGAVNPDTHQSYPPFITDTVAVDGKRNGAYRFIVPNKTVALGDIDFNIGAIDLQTATLTGSSVVGHPDVTIVHTPGYYSIQGVDLSHYNGEGVDFRKLKSAGLRFAYLNVTQGANIQDPLFAKYMREASGSGLRIGAYHFFNFCQSAQLQFENIKSTLPDGGGLLPFSVDLEWNFDQSRKEIKPTDCGDLTTIRLELRQLLNLIESYYGVRPVIYTVPSFLKTYPILDESFNVYPLWVGDFSGTAKQKKAPKLPGNNPWNFWQVSYAATFPQLPGQAFDLSVFFGTERDFEAFAAGKGNVALDAALGRENTTP